MPRREHFAVINARLLADPRVLDAADAYTEEGIALEDTSVATVLGHLAMLAIWVSREGGGEILPDDGVATFRVAVTCTRRVADVAVTCLLASGLLWRVEDGTDLIGCEDGESLLGCYDTEEPRP